MTVESGAGAQTTLHTGERAGAMTLNAAGLTIPAHGSLRRWRRVRDTR